MTSPRPARLALLFIPLLLALACGARAQAWPEKPVRVIVPFSAGALTDTLARMYGEHLSKRLGQPVVVENKAGGGGIPAMQTMLSADPDGYVFQMVSSAHAVNPTLFKSLPYDTIRDTVGVAHIASSPTVAVVNPALGVRSLPEFIQLARSKPGKLTFGSAGNGSSTHLVAEYLRKEAGIELVHVPYKGVQEAVTEVLAGRIDIAFPPIALALAQMKAGRIVGIAQTGTERSALIPEIGTAQEAGLKGFDYSIWYALIAPAKTPRPILERMAREIREISALPEVREKMQAQGLVPRVIVLDEFDRYIRAEIEKQGGLVKASGATAG
jgi:tripartite-type tricarboxylate transporter receptor subunit TctC